MRSTGFVRIECPSLRVTLTVASVHRPTRPVDEPTQAAPIFGTLMGMSSRHRWSTTCTPPGDLVRPVRIDPAGVHGPTRGQARGKRWRQVGHGWYVPSSVDSSLPEQRITEAAAVLPPGGAVTGWASLRLQGANFHDGLGRDGKTQLLVPLVVGPECRRTAPHGAVTLRDRLPSSEVIIRQGIPCAIPERAVFDEMRRAMDERHAAVAFDMAAAARLTSLVRTRRYVDLHRGWDGVPLARAGLALADEASRSPQESLVRMVWELDARRPRPLTNREIFEGGTGRLLGVADLLDPVAGVVGEVDGADHAGAGRRSADADRDSRFRNHGLEVFRVTSYDNHHPRQLVRRIHEAYDRAARASPQPRTWTLQPPPWWVQERRF